MSEQPTDLTSSESVAKSQEAYDRIKAGEVTDVPATPDVTHGRTGR